ncbi:hypothetical protein EVAR_78768_1 [Eumeta japonica]|uniref:Uncharacterized protein n=1 Tax=Eumeta variegata TaxID=151549 RepID=A0A4C1T2B2_EUMVA|nr:hypothetical protein EVAR_78768_1 [Eumeta japonica]
MSQDNTESSEDTFLDVNDEMLVPSECEQEDIAPRHVRSIRERKQPEWFKFSNIRIDFDTCYNAAGLSLHEALTEPEKEQWKTAVAEEL